MTSAASLTRMIMAGQGKEPADIVIMNTRLLDVITGSVTETDIAIVEDRIVGTHAVYDGKTVTITANFAKYHDFYEAVKLHGKLFHNGYYDKAMEQYAKDKDPFAFARNITGTYATDPEYGDKLSSIMRDYNLV